MWARNILPFLFISNLPEFRKFFIPLHPLILETNNKQNLWEAFFGTVAKATSCVADLFYGTDYNSHLGTKRGGLATYDAETEQFTRSIHNLESTYFRTKFEDELDKFKGNSGIGIISDTDPQPLILNSHLGRFAIVTVAKIVNLQELETKLLAQNMHFAELSSSNTNQTELIALLIIQGRTFVEGIENVFKHIKGSCSMLLLTEDGSIIAARDRLGTYSGGDWKERRCLCCNERIVQFSESGL